MKSDYHEPVDILELSSLFKKINSEQDMMKWVNSPAYNTIYNTLIQLNASIRSTPRSAIRSGKPIIRSLEEALSQVQDIVKKIKPIKSPMRFGNRAFRSFLTYIWEHKAEILSDVTTNPESQDYFCQSFGSWTRLDYGTGHEFNFLAFIATLVVQNILTPEDFPSLIFNVLWYYYDLVIQIQDKYSLEPAGSHGSWGVDDYVALPFVLGSSQLIDHPILTPKSVVDQETTREFKDDFLYCRWIDFLYQSKSPPFSESSRMLYSLRTLPHFAKLNNGMLKMYKGEVMDRFLVVQHFRFGNLLRWE